MLGDALSSMPIIYRRMASDVGVGAFDFERFVGVSSGQVCHRTATFLPHNRGSLQRQACARVRRNLPDEQPFLRIVPYMPTFRLTRISSPGLLAKISPDCLLQFLGRMREHLEERGFVWPRAANEQIDYEKLGNLLHFPKEGLPPEMIIPLVLVDEMSTDLQMDRLLGAAIQRQIELAQLARKLFALRRGGTDLAASAPTAGGAPCRKLHHPAEEFLLLCGYRRCAAGVPSGQ
jgi:hypothetical protein